MWGMCLGALLFSGALSAILNSDGDGILLVNVSKLEYCRQQRSLRHRVIAGQPFSDRGLVIAHHSYHCSIPPYIQVHCHQTTSQPSRRSAITNANWA